MSQFTYLLTEAGKAVRWSDWKKLGGCGLSNYDEAEVSRVLGDIRKTNPTLGQLQDVRITAGRGLARFAKDHLNRPEWAQPEGVN